MKKVDILSPYIYEFALNNDALVNTLLNDIKNYHQTHNIFNSMYSADDPDLNFSFYNEELFNQLNQYLDEICRSQFQHDSVKLEITECWANETTKYQNQRPHIHPNSVISGIVYLTDHPKCTTRFIGNNPYNWTDPGLRLPVKSETIKSEVVPEVGKVIFFPSNVVHDTAPNLYSETRYTIAFNTFIKGSVGRRSAFLNVSPRTVEDVFKDK